MMDQIIEFVKHNLGLIWVIGGLLHCLYLGMIKKIEGDFFTVFFTWIALWPFTILIRVIANFIEYLNKNGMKSKWLDFTRDFGDCVGGLVLGHGVAVESLTQAVVGLILILLSFYIRIK
jgi:hypothetical protein